MNVDIGNNWDAQEQEKSRVVVPPKLQWPREDAERPQSILEEATAAIKEREARYGKSDCHHKMTAALWSTYLGRDITSTEVAIMFILDKISRQRNLPTYKDNYVDMAGYADRAGHNALGV
jgi:hypothetical protein